MPLPFRGAHAPAVQGADASCVGGARGGRVSGAHEQQPTVDGRLHASLQPSRPHFRLSAAAVPATTQVCALIAFLHCDLVPFNFFC
jgi:hypothetical protein